MRLGEGVLLAIWLLIGAASSAWLESRLSRERDLDWADYAILFGYAVSGPFALLAVAGYLSTRPRSRQP